MGEREQQCRTPNPPVSKGYGLTIHKSAEENYCVGKSSKILCVKMKNEPAMVENEQGTERT